MDLKFYSDLIRLLGNKFVSRTFQSTILFSATAEPVAGFKAVDVSELLEENKKKLKL